MTSGDERDDERDAHKREGLVDPRAIAEGIQVEPIPTAQEPTSEDAERDTVEVRQKEEV